MTSKTMLTPPNEQASWIDQPNAGIRTSWKNRYQIVGLLDGAYFGLNGDSILDIDDSLCVADKNTIVAHNPGIRKISQFLSDIMFGKILAVLDKNGIPDTDVTFPEAENNGWIQEKTYISAWHYLGKEDISKNAIPHIRNKDIPLNIYQVTKKGVGKISLSERDVQRPNILYFFGLRPRI